MSWLLTRDQSSADTVNLVSFGGDSSGKVTARDISIAAIKVDNLSQTFVTP